MTIERAVITFNVSFLITASAIAETSLSGDSLSLSLDLDSDHDYLIEIPVDTFSCGDGSAQSRAISHYFRVVDFGIECSFGSDC